MKKLNAFTLVEISVVVVIIVLLVAVSLPVLKRARINTNEATAILATKTIYGVTEIYRSSKGAYPASLTSLASPNTVPPYVSLCEKDSELKSGVCDDKGYRYQLIGDPANEAFFVTAVPIDYGASGVRGFYIDETGIMRYSDEEGVPGPENLALEGGVDDASAVRLGSDSNPDVIGGRQGTDGNLGGDE